MKRSPLEVHIAHHVGDFTSTIDPLPYFPDLAKTLHGPTLALVLTYLEFHHPTPAGAAGLNSSLSSAPITLDCDQACADLGISRRTLHIALSCLGCWWSTEEARSRAARAGREFLNLAHSLPPKGHDPVKIYSVTGSKAWQTHRSLAVRRNYSKLASILAQARIIPDQSHLVANGDTCAPSSTVSYLPHILAKLMPNWGDRRAERWDRWRRENGKKSRNPGRMRKSVRSPDVPASDYAI